MLIELYHNGKIDTLCLSDLGILYNNKAMIFSDELFNFIETIKSLNN